MTATIELFDDRRKRFSDFAQKDYELKVGYLTSHFQRMWTRFNYFVVVQAALLGGRTIFGGDQLSVWGAVFGLVLSIVWYVMGAEDRYLVALYRRHVNDAADLLITGLSPNHSHVLVPVGEVSRERTYVRQSISGWRLEPISTTRLAALIPLLAVAAWFGMLISML